MAIDYTDKLPPINGGTGQVKPSVDAPQPPAAVVRLPPIKPCPKKHSNTIAAAKCRSNRF
jgi:hypothetical protein